MATRHLFRSLARSFVRGVFRTSAKVTRCRSGRRESYCAPRVSCCFLLSPRDVASYESCAESADAATTMRYLELSTEVRSSCPESVRELSLLDDVRATSRDEHARTEAERRCVSPSGHLDNLSDDVILKSNFNSILLTYTSRSLINANH